MTARKRFPKRRTTSNTTWLATITSTALPGKTSRTAWSPPQGLTYEQWLACGRRMMEIESASQWWLGDWWNASPAYGERVVEAQEYLPIEIETVRTYAWVAANVSTRIDTLSFTHHRLVAPFPPPEQRKWLDRAVRDKLSAGDLCEAIMHARTEVPPQDDTHDDEHHEGKEARRGEIGPPSATISEADAPKARALPPPAIDALSQDEILDRISDLFGLLDDPQGQVDCLIHLFGQLGRHEQQNCFGRLKKLAQ